MKILISSVGVILLCSLSIFADDSDCPPSSEDPPALAIAKLDPKLDRKEVTIRFSVSELGGVAQISIPGKAPTFVIEATSEHKRKDLTVWIEGELADVLDRLQLSYGGSNQLKKGTTIVATGSLTFSPGAGDREGHEWYALHVEKWQNFRIVGPVHEE
ncbi:MAG: hypothetical protein JNL58_17525 [Planctomyces sp.]|nr:hypothetical protein [Planctomyces sp.]